MSHDPSECPRPPCGYTPKEIAARNRRDKVFRFLLSTSLWRAICYPMIYLAVLFSPDVVPLFFALFAWKIDLIYDELKPLIKERDERLKLRDDLGEGGS